MNMMEVCCLFGSFVKLTVNRQSQSPVRTVYAFEVLMSNIVCIHCGSVENIADREAPFVAVAVLCRKSTEEGLEGLVKRPSTLYSPPHPPPHV